MQFNHTFQAVLDGRKTQTRRLVKPGEYAANSIGLYISDINEWVEKYGDLWDLKNPYHTRDIGPHIASAGGKRKWEIGSTYAIQPGRGKKSIGRIRITGIRQEDVREISDADVVAEGFRVSDNPSVNRGEFLRTWCAMHDPGTPSCARHVLKTRPAERYRAWVLEFELEANL